MERIDDEQRKLAAARCSGLRAAVKALDRPADVIAAIADAPDQDTARRAVMNLLDLDATQAQAVLDMKWGSATRARRAQAQSDLDEIESLLRSPY